MSWSVEPFILSLTRSSSHTRRAYEHDVREFVTWAERGGCPAPEGLDAVGAVRNVPDPRLLGRGQLERRPLVVAEASQVHRVASLTGDLHAEDLPEVVEALVGLRRQQLDVREVREVTDGLCHVRG